MASEPIARGITNSTSVERPHVAPPHAVPVALRTVKRTVVTAGRFEPSWSKRFVLAKWVIAGQAEIGVNGRRIPFGRGDVAIYLPTSPHQFWAIAPQTEFCWFTVDGPMAEQLAIYLDLKTGAYPYGSPPLDKIDEMIQSLQDVSIEGHRRSSLLAIEMLYEVASRIRIVEVPEVIAMVESIILQEFADPDLSTERIASRVDYHRGSISRLFHQHAGVTLSQYIAQVRLQQAKAMLQETPNKIGDIARKCGFREPTYFCRWFHKHTGQAPGDMRRAAES